MNTLANFQVSNTLDPIFLSGLTSFSGRIKTLYGSDLKALDQDSLTRFEVMTPDKQDQVQKQFTSYLEMIGFWEEEIKEISESKMLESCAKKLGVVFDPRVYNTITNEHIIEIYTKDLFQIYRNLGFFNLCSYNLMDLLTNEFYELYERSLQVNVLLIEATEKLSKRPYSLEPESLLHIPQHIMREKFSPAKKSFMIQFQAMYPIYTWSRDFYGFLMIQEAKEVSQDEANLHFI
jgi:hypothetical protein